jgi:phosphoribosylformylglycinamidine synthase
MFWKIEVREKPGVFDAVGEGLKKDIYDLGIKTVLEVNFIQVYIVEGDIGEEDAARICRELLVDGVYQDYSLCALNSPQAPVSGHLVVEVAYNPGVMDPVEQSVLKGIRDLGIEGINSVRTAKKYLLKGKISPARLKIISEKLLYNKLIQHIVKSPSHSLDKARDSLWSQVTASPEVSCKFNLITVDLINASDEKLKKISRDGQLFLNLAEMRQLKKYFKKLRRDPTDCELETFAQTWSEHCGHKTFRGKIRYEEVTRSGGHKVTRRIDNLLKSTIMKVTKELNKPWCVSVFQDNSGVIKFDDKYNVCFKVETHNHPSALEPFGGANTGIGGVIRDPLGTGLR